MRLLTSPQPVSLCSEALPMLSRFSIKQIALGRFFMFEIALNLQTQRCLNMSFVLLKVFCSSIIIFSSRKIPTIVYIQHCYQEFDLTHQQNRISKCSRNLQILLQDNRNEACTLNSLWVGSSDFLFKYLIIVCILIQNKYIMSQ